MKLIYCRGLNCHLACILSVAQALGADCRDACVNLWSETDFRYDREYQIYVSRRVFYNLSALGIDRRILPSATTADRAESLMSIPSGDLFVAGMDTFFIPWNPVYQHFHGPHYFIAEQSDAGQLRCFDPVYGVDGVEIGREVVCLHAFDLIHITQTTEVRHTSTLAQEARAVLSAHPETRDALVGSIRSCAEEGHERTNQLIGLIDAMTINRRLFFGHFAPHMGESILAQWEAVKNGLLKTLILRENSAVLSEVCGILAGAMQAEMDMAMRLASMGH